MTSRSRGSGDPAKLASTAAVMSAGVVGWEAVSGALMAPILAHGGARAAPRGAIRRAGVRRRSPAAATVGATRPASRAATVRARAAFGIPGRTAG
jgi:hypothetical protein